MHKLDWATVTFLVLANGTMPINYQWQFNGIRIIENATATNSTLTLTNVQTNQAGNYSVIVSDGTGSVVSITATLTVVPNIQFGGDGSCGLIWSNGVVRLHLTGGLGGSPVVLEISTDLITWRPILTNAVDAPLLFTDPAGAHPQRFYRVWH